VATKRKVLPAPPSIEPRTVDLPPLSVRAVVEAQTINDEARTVDLVLSTGAAVERYDWFTDTRYLEVLSLDPSAVRLGRLNDGAPLLDSHSAWSVSDMLGSIVPGSVVLTKSELRATARFSKREAVAPVWQDVRDGHIRSVSIGYRVHRFEESSGNGNKLPVRKAVDWEPYEGSMVPIPADAGAKVRGEKPADTNPCQIVTRGESKEKVMEDEARSETIVETDQLTPARTPDPPAATEPNERDEGSAAERARVRGIRNACLAARVTRSFEDKLIDEGIPLVEAQNRIFDELRKRDQDSRGPSRIPSGDAGVTVGDDPLVHVRAGLEGALLHRVAPDRFKLDDKSSQYRGMSLLDMGRAFLKARGIRVTDLDRSRLVDKLLQRTGLHTTSDFPGLFEDAANKNLRAAYEAAPQTWLPISKLVSLSDFKPSRQLQVGDAPALLEILEHGEYTFGTIGEAKESIQLKTYGRMFGITRQALINDDLNAFGEVPAAFGRKARDIESDLAWAQITSNPTMGDSVALFDAAGHFNYTASGTAIDVTSLGVGRAAIRKQKGIDAVTPLNLSPQFLIVPAGKETIADQYVTQITPAQGSTVNPFAAGGRTPLTLIVEPRLDVASATAWYMATATAQAPVLYHGILEGQEGPLVSQQEGFDVDGMKFRCRIDVAFKAADWRAIYKNVGA
jgi:hypothetical protein